MRKLILCLFSLFLMGVGPLAQAQPTEYTFPPCKPFESEEEMCLSYTTVEGQRVCRPDGWKKVCVPATNTHLPPTTVPDVLGCQQNQRVCIDTTPSKEINSVTVTLDMVGGCWEWQSDFTCVTENMLDTCQPLREDDSCAVSTRRCLSQGFAECAEWEVEYQCLTKPSRTEKIEFCGDTELCVGGICWDTGYMPDEDFANVITDMETSRQIGTYSPDGLNIFGGVAETCRSKRAAGLKNCCSYDTSARSNNKIMGEFISGAVGFGVRAGSKYMFDALYGDTLNWISSGWAAAVSGNLPGGQSFLDGISSPSFGMYGFSIGGTGTFLGTSGSLIGSVGGFQIYFNPYAFAFSVGLNIIMSAMTCSEGEAKLAMKRGAGLCTNMIDDWCTKSILGVCITRKRSYCCYNSKIAKIINTQGREQLGRSWGSGENPSCEGFTAMELERLDFSQIDMSEFVGDVMEAVDTSHFNYERNQSMTKDYEATALKEACTQSLNALGGDIDKLPKECKGLI